eukprot:6208936-Pleurochrysis_carterae.AAC.5
MVVILASMPLAPNRPRIPQRVLLPRRGKQPAVRAREGVGVDAVGGGAREGVELRATLAHALRVGGVHFVVDELARGHVPARVEVGAVTQRQVRVRLDDPTEVDLLARL